jgi:ABC-type phosphate transport system auxiliary subunit
MIVAGFQWMTAAGNETKVEKALSMIKTAVIGLIIVLAAYAITYFIFTYLPFSGTGTAST